MSLVQRLIDPSKYDIKCPYPMDPIGICIHNTANDAPAENEISYMQSNNNEVSFHVAVDDTKAIQGLPFNRNAWAAGDGGKGTGNRYYIHYEICYSRSGGDRFLNAEKRAAKEIAEELKRRGWGIDRVKKHQDFSGKYCPHRTLDLGYNRIIEMIKAELGNLNGTPAVVPNTSKPVPQGAFYRVVAGSYLERANAEEAQAKLKAVGFDSFLLPVVAKDSKTYLRVIAGSYKTRANAEARMNELIASKFNAFIAIYTNETTPSIPSTTPPAVSTPAPSTPVIAVGSKVNIVGTKYATGQTIPSEQKGSKVHTVMQITGERVLLKEIMSWVYKSDVVLAGTASTGSATSTRVDKELKRYPETGVCYIDADAIKFRNAPTTDSGYSTVEGTYYKSDKSVNYDLVVISEKYVWVSWIGATSKTRRYMPITVRATGESWAHCE